MKPCLLVLGVITLASMASSRSHACCNSFPATASSVMQFHGTRGTLASPFVIPREMLRITRRTCDDPSNTSFPADVPDDVRTVVIVRPHSKSEKIRAIVLKPGTTDGPCDDGDAFTASCQTEIRQAAGAGDAECFTVTNYDVQPSVVDVEFPALPSASPPRATSSPAAVAVLRKDDPATVCGQLAKGNHCSQVLGAQPGLLACIDQIGVPTDATSPCSGVNLHPVFREATLLPVPNEIEHVCHKAGGGLSCDSQPADELRYAVDKPANVLMPMSWETSLDACSGESLRVHGEVRSPCTLQIPANDAQFRRNTWLESYTFDGRINLPEFAKDPPSNAALNRFDGTTDEPFSVLRFGAHYGMCSSSSAELCNHPDRCSSLGDTCDSICTNNNAACGASQPCASGGGQCGTLHDFRPEYAAGRWRVGRNPQTPASCMTPSTPHGFCEDQPATLCNGNGQCASGGDCASYLLTLDGCEDPGAGATVPSTAEKEATALPPVFNPLLQALGVVQVDKLVAEAFSDDALAVIVPAIALGDKAARCKALGIENVLVAASTAECRDEKCSFTCPPLGAGALVQRLAVYGTRVRFLQLPDVAAAAPGMFNAVVRFFRGMLGGEAPQPADVAVQGFLRILDTATSAVTTVGEVVISDHRFDPFAIGPSGATKLLAHAARCVTSDGRTLGIPSFCHPDGGDECPAWSTCQAADVVMVMDLSRAP